MGESSEPARSSRTVAAGTGVPRATASSPGRCRRRPTRRRGGPGTRRGARRPRGRPRWVRRGAPTIGLRSPSSSATHRRASSVSWTVVVLPSGATNSWGCHGGPDVAPRRREVELRRRCRPGAGRVRRGPPRSACTGVAPGPLSDAGARPDSWRSRNPVSVAPARNSGWRRIPTSSSRLVVDAVHLGGSRASARRSAASARVGAQRDHLGQHGVVVGRHDRRRRRTRCRRAHRRRRGRGSGRGARWSGGSRRRRPRRTAGPRWRGRAMRASSASRGQRLALGHLRAAARTRSSPVTISVTGCSTCSRVFISRK